MKIFFILEDLINKVLNFVIDLLIIGIQKLISPKVKQKFRLFLDLLLKPFKYIKAKGLTDLLNWRSHLKKLGEIPKWFINNIKTIINIVYIKKIIITFFTENLVNFFTGFKKNLIKKHPKKLVFIICIVIGFIFYIIKSRIRNSLEYELYQIKMAEKNIARRPPYFMKDRTQILTEAIKLPLAINKGKYSSVEISFVAQASNNFILIFLKKFEYRIKDHLYTTIAPTLTEFIFKPEGKRIISQKIKDEINFLLKEYKVRGHVSAIYIIEIILP